MYDPARDIFTSSEDATGDQTDLTAAERRSSDAVVPSHMDVSNRNPRDIAGDDDSHTPENVTLSAQLILTCDFTLTSIQGPT